VIWRLWRGVEHFVALYKESESDTSKAELPCAVQPGRAPPAGAAAPLSGLRAGTSAYALAAPTNRQRVWCASNGEGGDALPAIGQPRSGGCVTAPNPLAGRLPLSGPGAPAQLRGRRGKRERPEAHAALGTKQGRRRALLRDRERQTRGWPVE
jgi:hypothetical protein